MSYHDKEKRAGAVARILQRTANGMKVEASEILSRDVGTKQVSRARMAFCYLIRPILQNHETGAILGRRTSGTIDSSWRRCLKIMRHDEAYRESVNRILDCCEADRDKYRK